MKQRRLGKRLLSLICVAIMVGAMQYVQPRMHVQAAQNAATEVSDAIGLVCNLFCVSGSDEANHAALQWDTTLSASNFILYRSAQENTGFTPIYTGSGKSCEDDDLQIGKTYYYQLMATDGKSQWYSSVKSLTAVNVPNGLSTYDNQKGSNLVYATSGTKVGNTYYNYAIKSHSGKNDCYLAETTSSDGVHFGNERNVADSSQNSALASCKIESVHITYMEKTKQIVVWAHWEQPSGYSDGKALVITGTPGGQFTVHHVYNPLNIQVRDMAVFVDDDGTGYLIAAANKSGQGANATLYIFKMNYDYSDVTEIVTTLFEDQYREFPNMIKKDGYYFLFTSQAAGWYPSSGAYAVTKNLKTGWSKLRSIGNTSTFSSQSGWIVDLAGKNYLMHAYRWLRASESSGTTLCPLYFDNGFAFYDYCPYFRYNTATGDLFPVQTGVLLSQDKDASSSLAAKSSESPEKAFDGSYQSSFTAIGDYKKWPFYLQVDLGQPCSLSNIQISWYICKGSEGYYAYTVEGSMDGKNWTKLYDHTDTSKEIVSKTYGFNSNLISGTARYVRLNVKSATLQNNPTNNWYTPQIYECKIYGTPTASHTMPSPAAAYDFENGSTEDISGNGVKLSLYGNAKVTQDSKQGSILDFDGTTDTYAAFPNGFLDGCRDYTVCMDVNSASAGNYFTFAAGKDDQKYAFFRIGDSIFRFAVTTDTWRGETEFIVDTETNAWHRYILVINGATAKLYIDNQLVSETPSCTASLADMGSGLSTYIGKSYYADDIFFTGKIDNLAIYKTALNAEEVSSLFETDALRGDVNADGSVTIADAVTLQKFLLTQSNTLPDAAAADMDNNQKLNTQDLALLKQMLMK